MTRRAMVNMGVVVGLVVALVVILWPGPPAPATDTERALALADRLMCPYCNGESIAEAPSAIARDLQEYIAEQVAAGRSDQEIIDFFVATYGEQIKLDPPLLGWGVWLWILPLLALGAGGVAIGNRLRGRGSTVPTDAHAIDEQLAAVQQDLADIEAQVAAGDLAVEDANRLRVGYEAEAALLADTQPAPERRLDRRRVLAGAIVLALGAAALTAGVVAVADDRGQSDLITGGVSGGSLDDVTNEELEVVVAENPDVLGMRLALAGRYFEDRQFSDALRHYLYVLDRQANNAEALAMVGWMTYLDGYADTGLPFVERALDADPDYLPAYWFLANIRYFAFDDAAGAVAPLERLLEADGLPEDVRANALELLDLARESA